MEDKLLTQYSSVGLSSQFLKVRNCMWERRNLWRTTLECNGAFFFHITSEIRYNLPVDVCVSISERTHEGPTVVSQFQQL